MYNLILVHASVNDVFERNELPKATPRRTDGVSLQPHPRRSLTALITLLLLGLLRVKLDQVVDAQDGERRLGGELDALELGKRRLEHALAEVVLQLALDEVEAVTREVRLVRLGLARVVVRPELGDEIRGVLGGVHRERLGNHEKRLGKLGDGELLAGSEGGGEGFEVDGESRLHRAAARDHLLGLEGTLHDAEGVVEGAVHLVEHVVVGAADEHGARLRVFAILEDNHVVVGHALLANLGAGAQRLRVEGLVALHVRQGEEDLRAGSLGDAAEVILGHAAARDASSLDEILERHVVDTLAAEDDVRAAVDHHLDTPRGDVELLLPNALELLRVAHQHLHPHLHLGLLEVEIHAGNLGVLHALHHALRRPSQVKRVPLDHLRLLHGLAVRLEDVDALDRVPRVAVVVVSLDRRRRVDNHPSEKVAIRADNLGAHARLGAVQNRLRTERVDRRRQLVLDVLHRLAHRQAVARDDGRRVDLVADQVVSPLEQLAGEDHDGGGAVADLAVLELRELHEDLSERVRCVGSVRVRSLGKKGRRSDLA